MSTFTPTKWLNPLYSAQGMRTAWIEQETPRSLALRRYLPFTMEYVGELKCKDKDRSKPSIKVALQAQVEIAAHLDFTWCIVDVDGEAWAIDTFENCKKFIDEFDLFYARAIMVLGTAAEGV